jgi:DNA phosphorothioation-associated putative methyltransferase
MDTPLIPRHRTAIRRLGHSRPVALAIAQGLLAPSVSFFDYGCGFGEDVQLLKDRGFQAEGWDPHYRAETPLSAADCVNLGYVLNVIEDLQEREQTLRRAFELARRVLVVSVRVDQSLNTGTEFADGLVTNSGSFQKIYTQREVKDYLQAVLAQKPYMASLGIAYIFKDESIESGFLSNVSRTPAQRECIDLFSQFAKDPHGESFVSLARTLGRPALPSEYDAYPELLRRFGSPQRIERLTLGLLDSEMLSAARRSKRSDILTYFAMLQLRGLHPPPLRVLPPEVRADIKLFWRSYREASEEGQRFLFQLGKPNLIREACLSAPVGKHLPTDFYVHRSAEAEMPTLLRVLLFVARQIVGEVDYNIAKLSLDGRKVSFLKYKDFDEEPHPELLHSVRVHLPNASYAIRDYSSSDNPPILHRKESFIDPLYENYTIFAELTRQEEDRGLLSRPDIGFKSEWLRLLAENHLCIVGHQLASTLNGVHVDAVFAKRRD